MVALPSTTAALIITAAAPLVLGSVVTRLCFGKARGLVETDSTPPVRLHCIPSTLLFQGQGDAASRLVTHYQLLLLAALTGAFGGRGLGVAPLSPPSSRGRFYRPSGVVGGLGAARPALTAFQSFVSVTLLDEFGYLLRSKALQLRPSTSDSNLVLIVVDAV